MASADNPASDDGATPLGAPSLESSADYFTSNPATASSKRSSMKPTNRLVTNLSQDDTERFISGARQKLYDPSAVVNASKTADGSEATTKDAHDTLSGKQPLHQTLSPPLQPGSALPTQMVREKLVAPPVTGATPIQSPGLFTPASPAAAALELNHEKSPMQSPMLSPYHHQPARTADKATKDIDMMTGRKTINQYEMLGPQLGQGVHAKVKLARDMNTGEEVALKIVQRFNKKRRLNKSSNPQDQIKKEVAILKKVQHPNVIRLIEVIDDPELSKVYIALEYCTRKELRWRERGCPEIVLLEYRRIEREIGNVAASVEDDDKVRRSAQYRLDNPQAIHKRPRLPARAISHPIFDSGPGFWSLEFGGHSDEDEDDDDYESTRRPSFLGTASTIRDEASQMLTFGSARRARSENGRERSLSPTMLRRESEAQPVEDWVDAIDFAAENPMDPTASENDSPIVHKDIPNWYQDHDDNAFKRIGSVDSQLTDMMDREVPQELQYVPTMTLSECRSAFRDVVLGLEYLHYHGIVHRDIKPMNLLRTGDFRIKISDFGVSYLGKPVRKARDSAENSDVETEDVDEETELAKTVGTPAFYAPELCSLDHDESTPVVTNAIDIWALGATLYCLLFARTPFHAHNEWALMKEIAEAEVYIPDRRLKAVYLTSETSSTEEKSSWIDKGNHERRFPRDFEHEEISEDLQDLLAKLLTKDPTERITIKEIKQHPWVVEGLPDAAIWDQETDPSRLLEGSKIQTSEKEVQAAVIPFSQVIINSIRSVSRRAGSALGFTGKTPRRRETSSAGSSEAGSTTSLPLSADIKQKERRRPSLKPDESLLVGRRHKSQKDLQLQKSRSNTASPEAPQRPRSMANSTSSLSSGALTEMKKVKERPDMPDRQRAELSTNDSLKTIRQSDVTRGRKESASPPTRTSSAGAMAPSPSRGSLGAMFAGAGRSIMRTMRSRDRGSMSSQAPSRQSSVGDQLDVSPETPYGEPTVAVSNLTAAGKMHALDPDAPRSPAVSSSSPSSRAPSRQNSLIVPSESFDPARPSPPTSNPDLHSMNQSPAASRPVSATVSGVTSVDLSRFAPADDRRNRTDYREALLSMQRRQQMEEHQLSGHLNVPRLDSSRPCPPSPDDDNPPLSAPSPHEPLDYFFTGESPGPASGDLANAISSASSDTQLTTAFSPIASVPSMPSLSSANSSAVNESEESLEFETKDSSGGNTETAASPPAEENRFPGLRYEPPSPSSMEDADSDTDDDFVEMKSSRIRPQLSRTTSSRSQKVAEHLIDIEKKTSRSGSSSTMKKISGSNNPSPEPPNGKG